MNHLVETYSKQTISKSKFNRSFSTHKDYLRINQGFSEFENRAIVIRDGSFQIINSFTQISSEDINLFILITLLPNSASSKNYSLGTSIYQLESIDKLSGNVDYYKLEKNRNEIVISPGEKINMCYFFEINVKQNTFSNIGKITKETKRIYPSLGDIYFVCLNAFTK